MEETENKAKTRYFTFKNVLQCLRMSRCCFRQKFTKITRLCKDKVWKQWINGVKLLITKQNFMMNNDLSSGDQLGLVDMHVKQLDPWFEVLTIHFMFDTVYKLIIPFGTCWGGSDRDPRDLVRHFAIADFLLSSSALWSRRAKWCFQVFSAITKVGTMVVTKGPGHWPSLTREASSDHANMSLAELWSRLPLPWLWWRETGISQSDFRI